jgi:hypothetical protein
MPAARPLSPAISQPSTAADEGIAFAIGPHRLDRLDLAALGREEARARLNALLLAHRADRATVELPVEISPRGLAFVDGLLQDSAVRIGRGRLALRARGGWTPDAIYRRQEHAAWMRLVDGRFGAARRQSELALQDYWRALCLARTDIGPDDDEVRIAGLNRRGQPALIVDGLLALASRGALPDMMAAAARAGARGALIIGRSRISPGPSHPQGDLEIIAIAIAAHAYF